MDIIFISELRITTLIGVYDWEKIIPQTLELNLEIAIPHRNRLAGRSDDFGDALDYAKIVAHIHTALARQHFSLLEALAEHVAQLVIKDFDSPWVKVSVAKLNMLRGVKKLGVSIERGEREKRGNKPAHKD